MSSLKQLRTRMNVVASTKKITSAMKMISVSKLRKAHHSLIQGYSYADEMNRVMRRLVRSIASRQDRMRLEGIASSLKMPEMIKGRDVENQCLLVCITSDEGMCGQFNQNVVTKADQLVARLQKMGLQVRVLFFGRRGADIFKRHHPDLSVHTMSLKRGSMARVYHEAEKLAALLVHSFDQKLFDLCLVMYHRFETAAMQKIQVEQLMPMGMFNHQNKWQPLIDTKDPEYVERDVLGRQQIADRQPALFQAIGGRDIKSPLGTVDREGLLKVSTRPAEAYDYEPSDVGIIEQILPTYMAATIYRILLDTTASESASRMVAMDNASKNAGDMMTDLHKKYHRKRQELVTRDLTEMIAGSMS